MPLPRYCIGDIVRMKKRHPCGGFEWEIIRVGMDFRIRCLKCGRQVMMPRPKFEKEVKEIVRQAIPNVDRHWLTYFQRSYFLVA